MRLRTLIGFVLILAGIIWLRNSLDDEALAQAWQRIALPYRVAGLYAEPADTNIQMPVAGVAKARVANTWQVPRSPGRKHEGQDIFARKGTPVLSATDGIVVKIGDGSLGGNAVFVLGPGGRTYYYAHLDRYPQNLGVGQQVHAGQLLGYVGNTGNARTTPPHLHFTIYTAGGAINPLPLIASPTQEPKAAAGD